MRIRASLTLFVIVVFQCSIQAYFPLDFQAKTDDLLSETSKGISTVLESSKQKNKLFTYENVKPFLWGEGVSRRPGYDDYTVFSDTMNLHPLGLGKYAFFCLWNGSRDNNPELLNAGKRYVDFLIHEYPFIKRSSEAMVYLYPFDNGGFKAREWHSGMANSVIALSFLQAYLIFKEPSYIEFAEQAMLGVTNLIQEGGSALEIDNGKWFLEYASETTNPSDAKFVLNGFLYQLLAVKLYGDITKDKHFIEEYNSGLIAYRELYEQYHYASDEWTYYNLNPARVEPPHYVIFDIILLDALSMVSDESLFESESAYRRNIIRSHYGLEYLPFDKKHDIFIFSQVGAPNPYWVDIYATTIRFISENDTKEVFLKTPRVTSIPIESRCFSIDTLISENYNKVEVWADYLADSVLLFESKIHNIKSALQPDIYPKWKLETAYKAHIESESRIIIENPAGANTNRGMIRVQFDQLFSGDKDKYLGVVVNTQQRYSALRIFLVNRMNEKASRYYLNNLAPGKDNLILISLSGLQNIGQLTDNEFTSIELHFYNSPQDEDSPYSIDIKDVVFVKSNYNLHQFLTRRHGVEFVEKARTGYLY